MIIYRVTRIIFNDFKRNLSFVTKLKICYRRIEGFIGIACINCLLLTYSVMVDFENLYLPSKHGRQQTISNTNKIKQL